MTLPRLYTPEEVAAEVGHLSPYTIRNLVSQRRIPCVRGTSNAILFTEELVEVMLDLLTMWPEFGEQDSPEEDAPFHFSSRSMSRHRPARLRRILSAGT